DSIREFQKEAIWRQMQEYKRDARRSQQRASDLERRQEQWTMRIGRLCHAWDQAVAQLDTIINSDASDGSLSSAHPSAVDSWLGMLLPTKIAETADDGMATDDSSSAVEKSDVVQTSLQRFNRAVQTILRQLEGKSTSPVDWQSAIERLSRMRTSEKEVADLRSQVAQFSRQIAEEREQLEASQTELRRALKKLDRSVCPTVQALDVETQPHQQNSGNSPHSHASGPASPAKGDSSRAESSNTTAIANGAVYSRAGSPSAAASPTQQQTAQQQQQLQQPQQPQEANDKTDYRELAERRLSEIEEKVRENTEIQKQLDALRLQISNIPDHIIAETSLFKQAEASREYYNAESLRLQAEVDRLFKEVAELKSSRTEFDMSLQAAANSQRQILEAELQRLQTDLVRVRNHRDQVQRELESRRAQDTVEDQKSTELKLLSDVRRERMNSLISENKRLLACIAVLKGDRSAFETYTDEELSKTTAVADELRAKLDQALRREKQLSAQLAASSRPDTSQLAADLTRAQETVDSLQKRLAKYESILGGACVDEHGQMLAELPDKADELAQKQRQVDEMILQRDSLQRTSEMMERELQTICDSFTKLEKQNTSKVWELASKEQHISRVVAEKCKYEEKFIGLNKDREAQKQANQALRHQNQKQLEHIKTIEERDRAMAQELSLASAETQQATLAWQGCQTNLQESQRRTQELEEQVRALEEKHRVATQMLDERTDSLSRAEHERRRAEEALELASKRVSEAEKITNQSGLAQMCADYKALLKCPTCQTHFKSHVLLRCMHVFCKECIDSRIETRQRKCPSCSEPFGAKDVRQIYL
ncbi:E3 ubiquitin-protein ligase bre1, partial [Linderina pennispora]